MCCSKYRTIPRTLDLASGALVFLNSLAPSVFAQSSDTQKIEAALLSLQRELPATLHKITPELLGLQKKLVDTLRARVDKVRDEQRLGQRTIEDVADALEVAFRELETLRVMAARADKESISEKELLDIRVETRSKALEYLQEFVRQTDDRLSVGEVTESEADAMRARALKAEIMLKVLQDAAVK